MIKEYIKKNPNTKIILGILWGVAVGLLFRAACYGRKCVIINAPKVKDVTSKIHSSGKEDGKCYRFVSTDTTCTDKAIEDS